MSRLGSQISTIRSKIGMTQKQLGKKLGVSEKIVSELESGKRILNDDLINRISKILGQDINDLMVYEKEEDFKEEKNITEVKKVKEVKIQETWNDAFSSVLKKIPVYKYDLSKVLDTKQLPIISNKVEGYSKDKVVFLKIEEDDMIGFRIAKGDIAFGYINHEVENNSICLLEYNGERMIRQVKRLDGNKVLLISNKGSVKTETVSIKDIKVLVKLDRVEIKL